MFKTWWLMGAAVLGASLLGSWAGSGEARAAGDPVLVGAGDIASCASLSDEAAAKLLDNMRGTVFAVGDTAYPDGTAAQFADCYGPSWGRHKDRTRPAVGNHEYYTPGAAGYFGYFGDAAGDPAEGYYSCDRGARHTVVLNLTARRSPARRDQRRSDGSRPTWPPTPPGAPSPTSTTPASPRPATTST